MLGLAVYLALQAGLTPAQAPRRPDQFILPFIGIPCTVVLWSAIGSFAAMLYRFNRHPIHEFTDAAKWLVTRPVRGVVVGSAFYLVFAAGLFLVGATPAGPGDAAGLGCPGILGSATAAPRELLILALAFLVGFSDRFGDAVFNALVERYAPGPRGLRGIAGQGMTGRTAEVAAA